MINMIKNKISTWKLTGLGFAIVLFFVAVACTEPDTDAATEKTVNQLDAQVGEIYKTVEQPATPRNGMQAFMSELNDILKYPSEASAAGIEGTVFVEFVVNKDGSLSDITLMKGIDTNIDKEALRAVAELTDWNPGKVKGEAVRTKMVLPITFKLD